VSTQPIAYYVIPVGKVVAFAAATVATFKAEYGLALAAGVHEPWAVAIPIASTVYGTIALATGKKADHLSAIVLMVICQVLAALVEAHIIQPSWWLVIVVACVPITILARVQSLRAPERVEGETKVQPKRKRRSAAQLLAEAQNLLNANPALSQTNLAELLDVSPRRLRVVLNGK